MKTLLLLPLLFLTSCGVTEALNKNCGSDIRMGCNFLFGMKDADQDSTTAEVVAKNIEQDAKIKTLENNISDTIENIRNLSESVTEASAGISENRSAILSLQSSTVINTIQLLNLSSSLTVLNGNLSGLQGQITALTSSLNKTIVDVKDPCGNGSGFDEVILKTKDGKYIGYFEQGSQRFLSILENGSYRTTDGMGCYFSVSAAGIVNEHY
jgi:hypothetical protein